LLAVSAERDQVRAALKQMEADTVDSITGKARDLTDDEDKARADLESRDGELSAEIEKLWKREERNQHVDGIVSQLAQAQGRAQHIENVVPSITAGEYSLLWVRANLADDSEAKATLAGLRETLARAHVDLPTYGRASDLTSDLAGILPQPIVGDLIKFVDANRYVVKACRELPMPSMGKTFTRPRASQLTTAGQQTEGNALSSQKMTLVSDSVTKTTQGGFVTLTEQDIDWTDPSFYAILIEDLAQQYAIQTDTVLSAAIVTAATNKVTGVTPGSSAFTVFYPKLVDRGADGVRQREASAGHAVCARSTRGRGLSASWTATTARSSGLNPFNAAGDTHDG
jgi:HK97 family phage major capsid protein